MIRWKKPEVDMQNLPRHIGIIMDGNGRWAKRRGLPRSAGHARGADNFKKIVRFCGEIGIDYLTVYAFSTENWSRPKDEVEALMKLLSEYLEKAYKELDERVRVKIIGERQMLSPTLQKKVADLEKYTESRTGMVLNIALSYGGRQEILHAVDQIAAEVQNGSLAPEAITEETISDRIYTNGQPDPDLIIRPSGEKRISNFLLWQCAYSEFWYSDILWPDFSSKHLLAAIADYQKRNRRFGGV
ncbi:MAG: isoprenyl transferase [Clostridia bacterium]|nr:isoprenyl transferase [Clostridia bacterium]